MTTLDEQHFIDWLENEQYRIACEYRKKLYLEIREAKKVMGDNNSLYLPILISSLKKISIPPYNKYEGVLCKEKQKDIFNKARKFDATDILHETIKKYLIL